MPHKYTYKVCLNDVPYEQWSSSTQDAYQEFKKLAGNARNYCNVSPHLMLKINRLLYNAVELDAGDGAAIRRASRILIDKVLTRNF
jgi:hypothetical protein